MKIPTMIAYLGLSVNSTIIEKFLRYHICSLANSQIRRSEREKGDQVRHG